MDQVRSLQGEAAVGLSSRTERMMGRDEADEEAQRKRNTGEASKETVEVETDTRPSDHITNEAPFPGTLKAEEGSSSGERKVSNPAVMSNDAVEQCQGQSRSLISLLLGGIARDSQILMDVSAGDTLVVEDGVFFIEDSAIVFSVHENSGGIIVDGDSAYAALMTEHSVSPDDSWSFQYEFLLMAGSRGIEHRQILELEEHRSRSWNNFVESFSLTEDRGTGFIDGAIRHSIPSHNRLLLI